MSRQKLPADPQQRALVKAAQQQFRSIRKKLEPQLLAHPSPQMQSEETRNLQYAQNVLRVAMEAVLNEMLPYSPAVAPELAIRLASYALSIAPLEDQDVVMNEFMSAFLLAHERRMSQGIRISSEWEMHDGRRQPNFPEGYR